MTFYRHSWLVGIAFVCVIAASKKLAVAGESTKFAHASFEFLDWCVLPLGSQPSCVRATEAVGKVDDWSYHSRLSSKQSVSFYRPTTGPFYEIKIGFEGPVSHSTTARSLRLNQRLGLELRGLAHLSFEHLIKRDEGILNPYMTRYYAHVLQTDVVNAWGPFARPVSRRAPAFVSDSLINSELRRKVPAEVRKIEPFGRVLFDLVPAKFGWPATPSCRSVAEIDNSCDFGFSVDDHFATEAASKILRMHMIAGLKDTLDSDRPVKLTFAKDEITFRVVGPGLSIALVYRIRTCADGYCIMELVKCRSFSPPKDFRWKPLERLDLSDVSRVLEQCLENAEALGRALKLGEGPQAAAADLLATAKSKLQSISKREQSLRMYQLNCDNGCVTASMSLSQKPLTK